MKIRYLLLLTALLLFAGAAPVLTQESGGQGGAAAQQGAGSAGQGAGGVSSGLLNDPNLTIRPGDTIRVKLAAGGEGFERTLTLGADGAAVVRILGEVKLENLRLQQAARKLREEFSEYYRDPAVSVDVVSLGRLSFLETTLTGEIRRRTVHSHYTLVDLLRQNNADDGRVLKVVTVPPEQVQRLELGDRSSVNPEALVREVSTRPGVEVHDARNYLLSAQTRAPRFLTPGELVIFTAPERIVEVVTGRKTPPANNPEMPARERLQAVEVGLAQGESLKQALNRVGLLEFNSDISQVVIEKPTEEGARGEREVVDLSPYLEGQRLRGSPGVTLPDRSRIYLPQYPETVTVVGGVQQPGNYLYLPERSVFDYIAKAGGYVEDAHLRFLYLVHPDQRFLEDERELDFEVQTVDLVSAYKEERPNFGPDVRAGDVLVVQVEGNKLQKSDIASVLSSIASSVFVSLTD